MSTVMIFFSMLVLGLSCGLGCGSVTTPFLLGRLMGEGKGIKESIKAVGLFSIGKIFTLLILGLLASFWGKAVISTIESVYPNVTMHILHVMTFSLGGVIVYSAIKKPNCKSCKNCSSKSLAIFDNVSYWGTGVLYALIPCIPLTTALTYAATLTPMLGFLLLLTFGIANSIIPICIYSPLIGTANSKVLSDVPQFAKVLKIAGGLMLIVLTFFL